ncbi:hypothetical protein QBC32DRAFT_384785 [Pseudoneurospora amorphoporcata]|uniref:Uncharacterized protein n=1 Tax=Pseudoneurospora amorphoporcata TaxID=241081 RepID=A0AAN6NYT5_9PEZI|nr:hypothetical protein QBC32DRAFT_384785 [Pseudoneurospora amorphoporcata]
MTQFHSMCNTFRAMSRGLNRMDRILEWQTQKATKGTPATTQRHRDYHRHRTSTALPTSHARTFPTLVRQMQRNNGDLSGDQRPVRENLELSRECVGERAGSPVTQPLCNMIGLYAHEVPWVRNTVSECLGGVQWENLDWWWWSYFGRPPIWGPKHGQET